MKILSLDPSLSCTGYWSVGKAGAFYTDSRLSRFRKLGQIHSFFWRLLKELNPDIVLIENYAFGAKNSQSVTPQAEVGGILRSLASLSRATVIEVAIPLWKSVVLGKDLMKVKKYTPLEKTLYLGHVKTVTKRVFKTCDEADAYMIALCAMKLIQGDVKMTDAARALRRELLNANIK